MLNHFPGLIGLDAVAVAFENFHHFERSIAVANLVKMAKYNGNRIRHIAKRLCGGITHPDIMIAHKLQNFFRIGYGAELTQSLYRVHHYSGVAIIKQGLYP
jgi:hypothetical protein